MRQLKLRTGGATAELARKAKSAGISKAAFIRKLVADAKLSDYDYGRMHEMITEAGRKLKTAFEADDFPGAAEQARLIRDMCKEIERCPYATEPSAEMKKRFLGVANGKAINVCLLGEEEKLDRLCEMTAMTKAVVLRALILGYRLPDHMSWQVDIRMRQLGGLIKHVAKSFPESGSREIERLGIEVGDIAAARRKGALARSKRAE